MFYLLVIFLVILMIIIESIVLLLVFKIFKINKANFIDSLKISVVLSIIAIPLAYLQNEFDILLISILNLMLTLVIFRLLCKKYFQINVFRSMLIYTVFVIIFLIIGLILSFSLSNYIYQPFIVSGSAMEPTISDQKYLLINKIDKNYKRGDIIVFVAPDNENANYIKRIIALPNEKIEIKNNQVLVNGSIVEESYILGKTLVDSSESAVYSETLGENQYFVMGDNRENSLDSRMFGLLDKEKIIGKIFK